MTVILCKVFPKRICLFAFAKHRPTQRAADRAIARFKRLGFAKFRAVRSCGLAKSPGRLRKPLARPFKLKE